MLCFIFVGGRQGLIWDPGGSEDVVGGVHDIPFKKASSIVGKKKLVEKN